jgi:histidine triad (HIT) family protein
MKTVFEKIIDGEIPATKVYEDDKFLAFLDINPVYLGHTLLIPKTKYTWMQEAPDELIGEAFITAKKLMLAIKTGLLADLVQVGVVGKDVPYFHIHLIPRHLNKDQVENTPYENPDQMAEYAQKIKAFL